MGEDGQIVLGREDAITLVKSLYSGGSDNGTDFFEDTNYSSQGGIDYTNAKKFSYVGMDGEEYAVFRDQLFRILGQSKTMKKLLSFADSGFVHLKFEVADLGENAMAHTDVSSREDGIYTIRFNKRCIGVNGWFKIAKGDNINYPYWSEVRDPLQSLSITIGHEGQHFRHETSFQNVIKEVRKKKRGLSIELEIPIELDEASFAVEVLRKWNYSKEYIALFFSYDQKGNYYK